MLFWRIQCFAWIHAPLLLGVGQVAKEYSEDKARQGGDLGWKRKNEVVAAFAEAAFALDVRPHVYPSPNVQHDPALKLPQHSIYFSTWAHTHYTLHFTV